MNKVQRWGLWAVVLCVGMLAGSPVYAEDKEIEAEGKAKIFAGNATRAKEEATNAALKEIIRLASSSVLGEELYKKSEKEVAKRVLATPKRYMNWFGVSSENYTTTEAVIKVKASVSLDKLKTDLAPVLAPVTSPASDPKAVKRALLLGAPIPPEEFAKAPNERKAGPTVPGLLPSVEALLKEAGYEVSNGGGVGPADDNAAIGARMKAASAQLAVVASALGGPAGAVSIVKQNCAEVSVRLFLYNAEGSDGGKFVSTAQGCDATPETALQVAGVDASARVVSTARSDGRLKSTPKRRVRVVQIPSFTTLETTTKTLRDLAGAGVELLGVDGGAAVYSLPAGAPDAAARLAGLLGAQSSVVDGVPTVAIPRVRVLVEGVSSEALLAAFCEVLGKVSGVTSVSAPALPEVNGTAEVWVWGVPEVSALGGLVGAQNLYGRALSPSVQNGALRVVVAPSSLGEKSK
jgi:hypothetical protein